MKKIGYFIFACFFYLFRILPVKPKKVFCIMTHDSSEDSSVGVVVKALKEKREGYSFYYIKKDERERAKKHFIREFLSFFVVKAYHLATASYVMLDNIFLPMAYLKFRKKVCIIQLWHGTGTIKKFGQSINKGDLKKLEGRGNKKITHLIVNSQYTKEQYSEAFGITEDKIYVWGLPRTDEFFNAELEETKRDLFFKKYPELKGKKLVLYAPTFRDDETDRPKMKLELSAIIENTDEDMVFLLKLHPFVAKNFSFLKEQRDISQRVLNVSHYQDINTLLFVSDILITDYSSIIFEYCLLERPMIFYAYDLDLFEKEGRGFYEDYQQYVPGPVARTTDDVIEIIRKDKFTIERVKLFKRQSYEYLDGRSGERLLNKIFIW
ncbi:CDP-glycerol glycerophosphotransferase family protein [Anaeromicropila populeti]|uniref:CDP-ribitol ribitolphosphotransferase n=1 Tax=Anaeromicropila populeti TaxID=37658 RepID=A0A1I6HRR5_9FIRM|nr:CDP-glycerol glycerophosphotransferase family protein [Anaeromicropila populeti]SFR57156.1 CDP-ribitol ribitolphosphotransferase [Anaeromicropila populeti]